MSNADTPSRRPRHGVLRWTLGVSSAALILLGTMSTVSYAPAISVTFVDGQGRALPNVWVAYSYRGARFNFVDSLSYRRAGALTRTGPDGRLHVPGFLHTHRPLDSGLQPVLEWVYSQELHNVSRPWTLSPHAVADRFEVREDPSRIVLVDQSSDPDRWLQALMDLRSLGRYETPSSSQRAQLHGALRRELAEFIARHGGAERAPPVVQRRRAMGAAEQEALDRQIARDLAATPRYGDYARRFFSRELERRR